MTLVLRFIGVEAEDLRLTKSGNTRVEPEHV